MGFYTSDLSAVAIRAKEEPAASRGGVLKKRAVGYFPGVHRRISRPRQTKSPANKGFHAVVLRTTAPGVPLYGYRYLSTELGRWPSRDPIGEKGGLNVYLAVNNSMIVSIDKLGMVRFVGCDESQKRMLEGPIRYWCEQMQTSRKFRKCLCNDKLLRCLDVKCDDFTVVCHQKGDFGCRIRREPCGYVNRLWGSTIHLCDAAFSYKDCGSAICTVIHELAHTCWKPREKWPRKLEKCMDKTAETRHCAGKGFL